MYVCGAVQCGAVRCGVVRRVGGQLEVGSVIPILSSVGLIAVIIEHQNLVHVCVCVCVCVRVCFGECILST